MNDYSKLKFLKDYENLAQNEALLNEIKGALFEYFVAAKLAERFDLTGDFLVNITESQRSRLQQYENWLRGSKLALLQNLVLMSEKINDRLLAEENFPKKLDKIIWSGEAGGEGDIILFFQDQKIPLSLKMCKQNSFVNTKSAGLKSVIKTYFGHFDQAQFLQDELNSETVASFSLLGEELYRHEDLGDFEGKFAENWRHSHLPGQLPAALQNILYQHYFRVATKLQALIAALYTQSKEEFLKGLWALCGLTHPDLWQIIWQYENQELPSGSLGILNRKRLQLKSHQLSLSEVIPDGASFSVHFASSELQIRVKPMNVFTTPAMKVNCAINYRSELFTSV